MTTLTNSTTTAVPTAQRGGRNVRSIARGLGVLVAALLVLAAAGAGYEAVAARGDAAAFPPPGQMVDVGGYRLHIQCVGTGGPTVVLDAGLGGTSLDWVLVQPEIGQTTRVCAYDRAGMGWSDSGPGPRTPSENARELHTLLVNAGIEGPYVLVGHSLAGKNVRLFAQYYPDLVAGMVLIDARSEYVDARTSPDEEKGFQSMYAALATVYRVARGVGLMRLIGAQVVGDAALPAETSRAIALIGYSPTSMVTAVAEARERTTDDAQLAAAPSLGDLPLVVLASETNTTGTANWAEAQQRLAALSTNSSLIVPAGSTHYIHWDHPAVVIDAVRQVVEQAQGE
ncbi:MAG: alpha/beta hydrolase [Anaerolineales bacterium]|nr:alpha/beta hydrolase [Anaerolineales bacterium]